MVGRSLRAASASAHPFRNVKILLIAPHPFFTERGTPIAVREMAAILSELGHEVTILTLWSGEDPVLAGVKIRRIPRPPFVKEVRIGLSGAKVLATAMLGFAMVGHLFRSRVDVLHAVEDSIFPALVAGFLFRKRVVYDMDSSMASQIVEKWPRFRFGFGLLSACERFALRRADWVLPVCPALAERCAEMAPRTPRTTLHDVPPEPVPGCPSGEPDFRAAAGSRVLALYVGNFEAYQGVPLLLQAMDLLSEPERPYLVLVGRGAEETDLRREAKSRGLLQSVGFPGARPLSDLPAILDQADILVSPRLKGENTPMKLYAYMRAGRAILATNILSHSQILTDKEAVLVDPSPIDFAEGLRRLVCDSPLRYRLGTAARRLSVSSFSRDALKQKIALVYDSLARAGKGDSLVNG